MDYDYIIIGGGPAGSTAAYCLQKRGLRCLVVERKQQLGEKTCGGLLPWRGIVLLNRIGLNTDVLLKKGAVPIKQFEYINDNGSSICHYHSGEYGLGVTRNLLDQWLLDQSCLMGADVLFGTNFKKIVRCENGFQVGPHSALRLIIASGATGFVPSTMRNSLRNQTFGLSLQVVGKTTLKNNSAYFFPLKQNSLDYFWIIPNGKQLWNIGIWLQTVSTNAVAQFWKYKKEIADTRFFLPS